MEQEFLAVQVNIEVKAGRFSPSFGTKLFPGMYSPPVHTVPKPGTDTLRLMVDHSSGKFRLNTMIACEDISGVHLDGICMLRASILQHHTHHHGTKLVIFKSDISAAYQQLPIHPFFQIITVDG